MSEDQFKCEICDEHCDFDERNYEVSDIDICWDCTEDPPLCGGCQGNGCRACKNTGKELIETDDERDGYRGPFIVTLDNGTEKDVS